MRILKGAAFLSSFFFFLSSLQLSFLIFVLEKNFDNHLIKRDLLKFIPRILLVQFVL